MTDSSILSVRKLGNHIDVQVDPDLTMPFWTTQDTRNALIATLIPGCASVGAFMAFARDEESVNWWQALRKPSWAPKDIRVYSVMDVLTLSPLGYASYMIYKNGGGFDYTDTRCALGLYGANIGLACLCVPLIKKRNLSCLWKNTLLIHLTAIGTAIAFYKIDKQAGLFMTPYALWTGFYTLLSYAMYKENQAVKDI